MQEVRKQVELNNTMTLLDLNGTVKSFKSEFIISSKDPKRKYLIAIITQDQLDKGEIDYVLSEDDGKFSRKVSYHLPEHLNHFIAIKKDVEDKNEVPHICDVYIRLTEESPVEEILMSPIKRADLEDPPSLTKESIITENRGLTSLNPKLKEELSKEIYEKYVLPNSLGEQEEDTNPFMIIGIICIVSVVLLLVWKNVQKK